MGLMLGGTGVSKGIAIGKACLVKRDELEICEFIIPKPLLNEEVNRYRIALKKTRQQLKVVRKRIAETASPEIAAFVDAHLLMLKDSTIAEQPIHTIRRQQCNAEWALKIQRDVLIDAFEAMADPYLSARKDDVFHVVERIQRNLYDLPELTPSVSSYWLKGSVVVADDFAPDDVILMHQQGVAALVTEYGGTNSHAAILARSLGIPAVVGVRSIRHHLLQSDLMIVEGHSGAIVVTPEASELASYREVQRADKRYRLELNALKEEPTITQDGQDVILLANMELPEDIPLIRKNRAAGVGLFRTEMLFMDRHGWPDEEEQFQLYRKVVRGMKGAPVTIRTLDFGADKVVDGVGSAKYANPAMGLRAIRLCLKDQSIFIPQLRAILRAAYYGPVSIMIPMLTEMQELYDVLQLIEEQKIALGRQGFKFDQQLRVGGMIEVPAAALQADCFASRLDFLSLGTNDLIQYTLAADRMDDDLSYLCDTVHPAVLRLIKMTINAGQQAGIPVSMCGEMAGDARYTRMLLALGLREFSMNSTSLLEVKRIIKNSHVQKLAVKFRKIEQLSTSKEIAAMIDQFNGADFQLN